MACSAGRNTSGWNINKQENIVLLPQEVLVAKIVELPAHCPYGERCHPAYSNSMKDWLQTTRDALDKAAEEKKCRLPAKAVTELDKLLPQALGEIKKLAAGTSLVNTALPFEVPENGPSPKRRNS